MPPIASPTYPTKISHATEDRTRSRRARARSIVFTAAREDRRLAGGGGRGSHTVDAVITAIEGHVHRRLRDVRGSTVEVLDALELPATRGNRAAVLRLASDASCLFVERLGYRDFVVRGLGRVKDPDAPEIAVLTRQKNPAKSSGVLLGRPRNPSKERGEVVAAITSPIRNACAEPEGLRTLQDLAAHGRGHRTRAVAGELVTFGPGAHVGVGTARDIARAVLERLHAGAALGKQRRRVYNRAELNAVAAVVERFRQRGALVCEVGGRAEDGRPIWAWSTSDWRTPGERNTAAIADAVAARFGHDTGGRIGRTKLPTYASTLDPLAVEAVQAIVARARRPEEAEDPSRPLVVDHVPRWTVVVARGAAGVTMNLRVIDHRSPSTVEAFQRTLRKMLTLVVDGGGEAARGKALAQMYGRTHAVVDFREAVAEVGGERAVLDAAIDLLGNREEMPANPAAWLTEVIRRGPDQVDDEVLRILPAAKAPRSAPTIGAIRNPFGAGRVAVGSAA